MKPISRRVRSQASLAASGSLMSQAKVQASRPRARISAAVVASWLGSRPVRTTSAPASASASAICATEPSTAAADEHALAVESEQVEHAHAFFSHCTKRASIAALKRSACNQKRARGRTIPAPGRGRWASAAHICGQ